ncbi:MAG: MFS transporter [Actinomycetaceae bacterium]|nr:MFS transporter [Actinomycetaceae bacterium]MDY6082625.1 MFS transporter [Actinomycetaceae bacterium]
MFHLQRSVSRPSSSSAPSNAPSTGHSRRAGAARGAFAFIVMMGVVSLFSDMTHEGARSILGEYLNLTGASATAIGFVSGFGELCGYSLRIISGYFADKSKNYWGLIIAGYTIQVVAIPALALIPEHGWILACSLVVAERIGKAVKKPAKNTLVSFAASEVGTGKGFAYQEFLDQLGAFLGPAMLFVIGLVQGTSHLFSTYRLSFALLGIPAAITISLLIAARRAYPHPENFEEPTPEEQGNAPHDEATSSDTPRNQSHDAQPSTSFHFRRSFAVYMIAICLFAFGFADFTLITLHVAATHLFPAESYSLLYAGAMAVDAVAALVFGSLYDKVGLRALMISTALSALFPPLIFLPHSAALICLGIALWGVGMGAQESIMKAAVATIIPRSMRATGYGIFETGFGVAWFIGSWLLGYLYDTNLIALVIVSVTTQLLAIVFYFQCMRIAHNETSELLQ